MEQPSAAGLPPSVRRNCPLGRYHRSGKRVGLMYLTYRPSAHMRLARIDAVLFLTANVAVVAPVLNRAAEKRDLLRPFPTRRA